ncbi:MAG: prepilin-type N-terminal cleavage/methylation domain-containing protein [Candidatus Brocadiaceae bacterium]|nr:prepilin-type N-terminal cleavage/methylation domain-containing protein [Candidatus Brocadiaceae bacterium]
MENHQTVGKTSEATHCFTQHKHGFTLFELLIAIFIGTLLILSGAYAIRIGLFSMGREEEWFNDSTREKAAYDFFWQQSSSLYAQKFSKTNLLTTDEAKTTYFLGEKDAVTFVSPLSLKKHYAQGLVFAFYKVKINDDGLWDLIYSEKRVHPTAVKKIAEEFQSIFIAEDDEILFFKDCDKIVFAYLDVLEEASQNGNSLVANKLSAEIIQGTDLLWKEKIIEKIPVAIKLSISKNGEDQEFLSPIMAMYSFLVYGQ